jgi:glutathione S-transferase
MPHYTALAELAALPHYELRKGNVMKLYVANAPSPAIARRLAQIKNIKLDLVEVDMMNKENRNPEFLKLNPAGQLPILQLDDGRALAELTAIAEYFEELVPDPVFVGRDAYERAETRMWMRRVDTKIILPMAMTFQHGRGAPFFSGRITIYESLSEPCGLLTREGMAWLDQQMHGRQFLCGDRITYADVMFHGFVTFFGKMGQAIDPSLEALTAYMERLSTHAFMEDTE